MQATKPRDPLLMEVRGLLAKNSLTQADIAKTLTLSRAGVARRMSGEVRFNDIELRKMARLFSVPVGRLFGDDEQDAA
jgi:transcriptional regulator with XRE-family HTH domain